MEYYDHTTAALLAQIARLEAQVASLSDDTDDYSPACSVCQHEWAPHYNRGEDIEWKCGWCRLSREQQEKHSKEYYERTGCVIGSFVRCDNISTIAIGKDTSKFT